MAHVGGEIVTLRELDAKYRFSLKKISKDSGITYETVTKIIRRKPAEGMTVRNARRIINALPITLEERAALIESLFAPEMN